MERGASAPELGTPPPPGSETLDDRPRAEAAAAAHRDEAVATTGALMLVQGRGQKTCTGRSGRVTERDRAAVRVHPLRTRPELLLPGEHHRGEGLVHLERVD